MFRYIALLWDPADGDAALTAAQLVADAARHNRWTPVVRGSQMAVFMAGAADGANQAHLLGDSGVVLGKLFRRGKFDGGAISSAVLSPADTRAILESHGHRLVHSYWGRYVAFIWDSSGSLVLRDPSGALPCYTRHYQGVSIVFSWLVDVLEAMPRIPDPEVNWSGVRAHVLLGALGGHETCLSSVAQVLPGEIFRPRAGLRQLLWNAADIARMPDEPPAAEAMTTLRDTVRTCTRSWANCYDNLLLRLSGGLDSSILLSCLTPADTTADVRCLNYHSAGADSDERHFARRAASAFNRPLTERLRDGNFQLERILRLPRTISPTNHLGRMGPSRMDAEMAAQHAAAALFSGGGGDQLLFEFHQWWPAADYLRVRGIDTGFPQAVMAAARLGNVSVWYALYQAIAERMRPRAPSQDLATHQSLTCPDALPSAELFRFTDPVHADLAALPIGKQVQVRQVTHPVGYYDPFELDAAPEPVTPLMSQPLVELALRWPTYLLTHNGRGRGLTRQAFSSVLPAQIAWRRSKGGTDDHVTQILLSHLDFARSLLLDGQLVNRGILDRRKVETALSTKPNAQQSHVPEIHFYLGIEAWLTRWAAP